MVQPESGERRSYVAIAVLGGLSGSVLAVDGGAAIFQIVALEELGLEPGQIGLAIGLGAVSIPVQLWAARIPLRLARRNLRMFFASMALLCGLVAWLIHAPLSHGAVVAATIAIAMTAELSVSVLYATSWQPLLSVNVGHAFRQRLNAQATAAGRVLLIGIVALVGVVDATGRTFVVIAIALVAASLGLAVDRIQQPRHGVDENDPSNRGPSRDGKRDQLSDLPALYVALACSAVPAWALFLTYAADVVQPDANLGALGAALTIGPLAVNAAWRAVDEGLLLRARIGAVVLLACALAVVALDRPVTGGAGAILLLVVVGAAAGGATIVRISLIEMAHRRVTAATSVRLLTLLDVVGSTAMQMGFLAGGFLIGISADTSGTLDPYLASLIAGPLLLLAALTRIDELDTSAK